MPKPYKIKRRRGSPSHSYKPPPNPFVIVLTIVGIVALVFVGMSIYTPVYNFIMGDSASSQNSSSQEQSSQQSSSVPESSTAANTSEDENIVVFDNMRAVYITPQIAGNAQDLTDFIANTKKYNVNTVLLNIKDELGYIHFDTDNQNANDWQNIAEDKINLENLTQTLAENNLDLAVSVSAFLDPVAPRQNLDYAVRYGDTQMLWLDDYEANGGKPWINPYYKPARDYITSLAQEAVQKGAKYVVVENYQFSRFSESTSAYFGTDAQSISKSEIIRSFVDEINTAIAPNNGKTVLYIPMGDILNPQYNTIRYGAENPLNLAQDSAVIGMIASQLQNGNTQVDLTNPYADVADSLNKIMTYINENNTNNIDIIPLIEGDNTDSNTLYTVNEESVNKQINLLDKNKYIIYQSNANYG